MTKARKQTWGFLPLMRYLERRAGKLPRIGKSRRVHEDIVEMGQDPYLGFVPNDLSEVDVDAKPPRVRPRFLGMFGPFGPLPNSMTREVEHWARSGDRSFVNFTDIIVARFQQLFYRSWSDARPITSFDHPSGGEFPRLLRSITGDADRSFDDTDAVSDVVRLRYTALAGGRVRSPVRLRQMLRAHFNVPIRIEEFVSSWLEFPAEDRSRMGLQGMSLGQDLRMGSRTPSIGEKITVHVECRSLDEYQGFLPGGIRAQELTSLVTSYIGAFLAVDVALWLPRAEVAPAQLGQTAQLGWTTALPAGAAQHSSELACATRFQIDPLSM